MSKEQKHKTTTNEKPQIKDREEINNMNVQDLKTVEEITNENTRKKRRIKKGEKHILKDFS